MLEVKVLGIEVDEEERDDAHEEIERTAGKLKLRTTSRKVAERKTLMVQLTAWPKLSDWVLVSRGKSSELVQSCSNIQYVVMHVTRAARDRYRMEEGRVVVGQVFIMVELISSNVYSTQTWCSTKPALCSW